MPHPLVEQLRFTRGQWLSALAGVPDGDGERVIAPMNSLGWHVAHLAWQEQRYWLTLAQGRTPHPELEELARSGGPASTPPLRDALAAWRAVTAESEPFLDALGAPEMAEPPMVEGRPWRAARGSLLLRVTYHYWVHIGEMMAIRQLLGHTDLPQFVGDIDGLAPYRPEA